MFAEGQAINFGSFGTTEQIQGGDYDTTVTAFEGDRAKFGDNPPKLNVQYTVDNGAFKGKSVVQEIILTYQGAPDDRAFAAINTLSEKSGLPMAGNVVWKSNPQDFAEQFQKMLAGDQRYRVRVRVGFDYKIDGSYSPPASASSKYWNAKDYDEAVAEGRDAARYPKVIPIYEVPQKPAEIEVAAKVPAALQQADGLPEAFGAQEPATTSPAYQTPAPVADAPF